MCARRHDLDVAGQLADRVKCLSDDGEPYEQPVGVHIPAREFDFGETACDPLRNRVYVAEFTRGGIWEVTPDTHELRRHQIGGGLMFPRRRFDGKIMVQTSN